jgi:intracellular sulfur oxidation DsrE/DsrF family protein
MRSLVVIAITALLAPVGASSQDRPQAIAGPGIEDFGATFRIANPAFATDMEMEYRVVFDVPSAPEEADQVNQSFNSVARFLNMHLAAGIDEEKIKLALVVHGGATWGVTKPEVYQEQTGADNPNLDLVASLVEAGVQVIVCGQSAAIRGLTQEDLAPGVQMALSAMTADVMFQSRGYAIIQY